MRSDFSLRFEGIVGDFWSLTLLRWEYTDISCLCSGSIEIKGNVSVGGDITASSKVRIYCNDIDGGRLKVGGKIGGSSVHVEGHLIVE